MTLLKRTLFCVFGVMQCVCGLKCPIMPFLRLIILFWESHTIGLHACKVKKRFCFLKICV